jgi:hypothetical protein
MQFQNHFGEHNVVSSNPPGGSSGGGGTSRSFGGNVVDLSNYYTKTETDGLLLPKANLTAGGKHVDGEVPDLAISNVFQVTSITARDALVDASTVQVGDIVADSTRQIVEIYTGITNSSIYNWREIDAARVAWDMCQSSDVPAKSATTKFAEIDTAVANRALLNHTHTEFYLKSVVDGFLAAKSNVGHTHEMIDVNGLTAALAAKSNVGHTHIVADVIGLQSALNAKSDVGHNHNDLYNTKSEITSFLAAKSDVGHAHDDRYYQKGLVDNFLASKSDLGHTHVMTDVIGLQSALNAKSDVGHNHNDLYNTKSEITSFLAAKSDVGHTHDDRYNTKAEIISFLAAKSDVGHVHDDRYYTETEVDGFLDTKLSKSVTNIAASGQQLWHTTGTALSMRTLTGSGMCALSETGGVIDLSVNMDVDDISTGTGELWSMTGNALRFRRIVQGNNISLDLTNPDTISISSTATSGGSANISSNDTDICTISNSSEVNFPNLKCSRSNNNTLLGQNAMIYSNANNCVMVGESAGWNSSGNQGNTQSSVFIGNSAGQQAFGSDHSIFLGLRAAYDRRQPSTIAIGSEAGRAPGHNSATEGDSHNIYIGRECGRNSAGASRCIFLGSKVGYGDTTGVDGQLRIGADSWKELIYGVMSHSHATSQFWVHSDTICFGSSLPTSQPSEARQIWKSPKGYLAVGALNDTDPVLINDLATNTTQTWSSTKMTGHFAPVSHTHPISEIVNLQAELNGKAPLSHTHVIADTTGLQTALDAKLSTTVVNEGSSSTAISIFDVSQTQLELSQIEQGSNLSISKNNGIITISAPNAIAINDLSTNTTEAWSSAKIVSYASPIGHQHAISDVSMLQATLNQKAPLDHQHDISHVHLLQTALNNRSLVGHQHTISDVSGLQVALDGKLDTNVTDFLGATIGVGLHSVVGTQLQMARLHAGANTTFDMSNGVISIDSAGGAVVDDLNPTSTTSVYSGSKTESKIYEGQITDVSFSQATGQLDLIRGNLGDLSTQITPDHNTPYQFLRLDASRSLEWSSVIGDSTRQIMFNWNNAEIQIKNDDADQDGEQCGIVSFRGNGGQEYGHIAGHVKSSTSGARKGYMIFRAPNGSSNSTVEVLRVGQAIFDTDCVGEFAGRVKCASLKINSEVQAKALTNPTTAQADYVLTATASGSWAWLPAVGSAAADHYVESGFVDAANERIVLTRKAPLSQVFVTCPDLLNVNLIDDNATTGNKVWSVGELHNTKLKGLLSGVSIDSTTGVFTLSRYNDINQTLAPPYYTITEVNTFLNSKMSNQVFNMGVNGEQIFDVSGVQLSLARIQGGTGITVTKANGTLTIDGAAGGSTLTTTDTDYLTIDASAGLLVNKTNICLEPVRFGKGTGQLTNFSNTVLVGPSAGNVLDVSSNYCTALGSTAMGDIFNNGVANAAGTYCVAVGAFSMATNRILGQRGDNVAVGTSALSLLKTSGDAARNTAFGRWALGWDFAHAQETVFSDNIGVGHRAGYDTAYSGCIYLGSDCGSSDCVRPNTTNQGHDDRFMVGNKDHILLDGLMDTSANSYLHVHGSAQVFNGNMTVGDVTGEQTNVSALKFETPWQGNGQPVVSQILSKGRALDQATAETFSEIKTSHSGGGGEGEIEFRVRRNNSAMDTIMSLNDGGSNAVQVFGILRLSNVPTSSAGLAIGSVWKDSNGFLKIA